MPGKINLTGQRFGRLDVTREHVGPKPSRRGSTWWCCRCDCGAEVVTSRHHLQPSPPSRTLPVTSCPQCAVKICIICEAEYPRSHPSNVCPRVECKQAKLRENSAADYRKNRPRRLQQSRSRQQSKTTEQRARDAESNRAYRRRLAETMDNEQLAIWRAKRNAAARLYHARLKTENPARYALLQEAQRMRAALANADPVQLATRREVWRTYARRFRQQLAGDPEGQAIYREQMRAWGRAWYLRMITDPLKRARYRASEARRAAEREAALFLADTQTILEENE